MKKNVMFYLFISSFFMSPAFSDKNKDIIFSKLPVVVQSSAHEHFVQENIIAVASYNSKEGQRYKIYGDIDGIQTTMVLASDGFVLSITQTFLKENEIDCEDVKSPLLPRGQEYYFQVEGLIQENPTRHCRPKQSHP